MIRLGIMGLGYIGRVHLAAAGAVGANVTAVASRRAIATDIPPGARVYHDYDEFVRNAAVDAIVLCLPTWLHEEYAQAAFAAGRHVLCEKPLALNAAAAERIVLAAEASGVVFMVAQVLRFWPHYVRLKEAVADGAVGAIFNCHAWRLSAYPNWAEWFRDPAKSGGALLDLQIHDLDLIYSLFGPPRAVACAGIRSDSGALDSVHTTLHFASSMATIDASFMFPATWPFSAGMRVVGNHGALEYAFRAAANIAGRDAASQSLNFFPSGSEPRSISVPVEDAYQNQLNYFLERVARHEPPARCPPRESLAVLRCIEACRQSAAEGGQPVCFESRS